MVAAIRNADWYTAFPEDYRWSYNVMIELAQARTGGAEVGEIDRICRNLAGRVGDDGAWFDEWKAMADRVAALGEAALARGDRRSACAHLRRASSYYFAAERFRFPKDEIALDCYRDMLRTFRAAAELDETTPITHVELPYVDVDGSQKALPAFFASAGPGTPAVVFMNGFDGNKELNWFLGVEDLVARGISVLSMDSPGVGEAIRFRDIPLRHDYEAAGSAALDWLEANTDVDAARVGVMALSLGGYYATRSASMEPRFAACVAWGAIWDYHRIWQERVNAAFAKQLPVPGDHLVWSTGTKNVEEALELLEGFRLSGVVENLRCPYLVAHGEDDQQVPVADAERLHAAAGSVDKTLRVFTAEEGGAQHCHMDNLQIAVPEIFGWLADRLGAVGNGADNEPALASAGTKTLDEEHSR
ncbi:alpha/beta fold hydrolase [Pseudonocardia ailaonensis]|uniref:Alpha/beta fold hydrolase n=1 Tax=Pseudonocardia ailaonensis TaxID=367279 RepID=A0ABN2NE79_9PSEU